VLTAIYEHEIANTWARSPDAGEDGDDEDDVKPKPDLPRDPTGRATGCTNVHKFFSAGTALPRCFLAVLHRRYLGQLDTAFGFRKTAFFQRFELSKLTQVHSGFSDSVILDMFAQFAELLYGKALSPSDDGLPVDEKMLNMLERLRQRHDTSRELDHLGASIDNTKSINVLLARLYMRYDRTAEAQALLFEKFARGVESSMMISSGTTAWGSMSSRRSCSRPARHRCRNRSFAEAVHTL
jgi:hypothetical protein